MASATEPVEGLRELQKQLKALGEKTGGRILRAAARKAMLPVLEDAQKSAPVGSEVHKSYKGNFLIPGYLSRHVRIKAFVSRDKSKATAKVGPTREAFYGTAFLERGTSKMPAQPWLVPAFQRNKGEVLDRFKAEIRAAIKRAFRRKAAGK